MKKPRVLFVCSHNSGRSQLAEELLRMLSQGRFEVESAGLEPKEINPMVIKVLKEEGIDISGKSPRNVFDLYREGKIYTYVITVCSKETDDKCPFFPGVQKRLNWPFPDPEKFEGTEEEKLEKVRKLKEEIQGKIKEFFEL